MERELVKIKSDNPAFTAGYYTQFKDMMKPGDVIYAPDGVPVKPLPEKLSAEPIKQKPAPKPAQNKKVKK